MPFIVNESIERASIYATREHLDRFANLPRFLLSLDAMHKAMADLFGVMPGGIKQLILLQEEGDYGALWAGFHETYGFRIGVPNVAWPALADTVERGAFVSALVHELGHVGLSFDWNHRVQAYSSLWPGAHEGFASPVGTYACVLNNAVPRCIDDKSGSRDWITLTDWAGEMINNGIHFLRAGYTGQESVVHGGHHPSAKIVEAVLFDLLFYRLKSYDSLRSVFRNIARQANDDLRAQRSDTEKMESFFIAWGRESGLNLAPYLKLWGFETKAIAAKLSGLPPLISELLPLRSENTTNTKRALPDRMTLAFQPQDFEEPNTLPISDFTIRLGESLARNLLRAENNSSLIDQMKSLRYESKKDEGFEIPAIYWRDDLSLGQNDYMIMIGQTVAGSGTFKAGHMLALGKPADLSSLDGENTTEPVYGLSAKWIAYDRVSEAGSIGVKLYNVISVIASLVLKTIREKRQCEIE